MTRSDVVRLRWLSGLLIALVALAIVLVRRPAPAVRTAESPASPGAVAAASGSPAVSGLRLDRLSAGPADLPAPTRDPFRFRPPPAPRPANRSAAAGSVAALPGRASVPGPPPPAPIALRLIGLVEGARPADRIAVFVDPRLQGQGSPIYGREGDIIEGRYRIDRVGADWAELAYVDGSGRQTLRLAGQ